MSSRDTQNVDHVRVEEFVAELRRTVRYTLGKRWKHLTDHDLFTAVAHVVRQTLIDRMFETEDRYRREGTKRLYYLSMEFLVGRSLGNNLINLGLDEICREALEEVGADFEETREAELDAALGNGGLGRLAACFLDSLATMDMPGFGYGINYEYGLFKQLIQNGYQKESPDHWLADGTPWQIDRSDQSCVVPVYGRIADGENGGGHWTDWNILIGAPRDMPIVGYGGHTVNYLRLYSARSSEEFDIEIFNSGDYLKAVEQKVTSERISKVLYPSDSIAEGKELRLLQEYFFVACALSDIFRRFFLDHTDLNRFPDAVAIQLNDTHPALTVAELMRLLVDEHAVDWDRAWELTVRTLGYTNHTLLPEALEKWPADLLGVVLPRHREIIERINGLFLEEVRSRWPGDEERVESMSILEENGGETNVRMANLAIAGSHSVNGVAALHSELIRTKLVPHFYEMWPDRFNNKTNGITQRRWLLKTNPALSRLITGTIGDGWITDLDELRALEGYADDDGFRREFLRIKKQNKEGLARHVHQSTSVSVDPASMFDVQAKRIHEYKRQLLSILHVIHRYLAIVEDGDTPRAPRTFLFAGKAAPGYWEAKQIIKLVNSVAETVNDDPRANEWMRVAFLPDYRVSLAEKMISAADLSEQISTAGMEASGTGNMKFALNGALTIGTLDGANIEIREEVGPENIFIFGHTSEEIAALRDGGSYDPARICEGNEAIARTVDALLDRFAPEEPDLFRWVHDKIRSPEDPFFHLADLEQYLATQTSVDDEYLRESDWGSKAILNVARVGKFSSDRTIRQYAEEIWNLRKVSPGTPV